ncbi:MAG: hypothetical protein JNK60_17330 [Acidobacteria bacterium]|nr:hypothetical protein [Acidobacteriota bacterium]
MNEPARAWRILGFLALVILGSDFAYLTWREQSLEPVAEDIDLTRPATYSWEFGGLHASTCFPAFRLELSKGASTDLDRIWGGSPPAVEIAVDTTAGRRLFYERSSLTRENGWIVTYGGDSPLVEVYKLVNLRAGMLESGRVTLRVLQGSEAASSYSPQFAIAADKTYALLAPSLGFAVLVIAFALAALVLAVKYPVRPRRGIRDALGRYRITLGIVDVSKTGRHPYTLEDLPDERFTVGFSLTDTSQPSTAIHQARPLQALVRLLLTSDRGDVVIDEQAPLDEWVWSGAVSEPGRSFVYRQGQTLDTPIPGRNGVVEVQENSVRIDEGSGSYFRPRQGERYTLQIMILRPQQPPQPHLLVEVEVRGQGRAW